MQRYGRVFVFVFGAAAAHLHCECSAFRGNGTRNQSRAEVVAAEHSSQMKKGKEKWERRIGNLICRLRSTFVVVRRWVIHIFRVHEI